MFQQTQTYDFRIALPIAINTELVLMLAFRQINYGHKVIMAAISKQVRRDFLYFLIEKYLTMQILIYFDLI